MYDYVFRNATIVDGSGNAPYKANVAIFRDSIALIGDESITRAKNIIDLNGSYLTPGFIDIHTHTELAILKDRDAEAMVRQGITTSVTGNCGIGVFPNYSEALKGYVSDVLGEWNDWSWSDYSSWIEYVEKGGIGNNECFLTSHTALRTAVLKNNASRAADEEEIKEMCSLLRASLLAGSKGFSSGLYYAPCIYANRKELIALLKTVKECDSIFTVHHRCEGNDVIESLLEVLDLAKESGVRLELSHLKAIGRNNQAKVDEMLKLIESYRADGVDVRFDQYPYVYGSTSLFSLLPPDILKLSRLEARLALSLENEREEIKMEMLNPDGWDSIYEMVGPADIKVLFLENNREYDGLTLTEIGKLKDKDPLDALLDILSEEPGLAVMADVTESEESLIKIMQHPLMCFGTDSLFSSPIPHPRSFHSTVELLGKYVRDKKVLTIEEAIRKMTGEAADRMRLGKRGYIKEGYKADLVVFDLEKLGENGNDNKGISHVFVNGQLKLENSKLTAVRAGEIL